MATLIGGTGRFSALEAEVRGLERGVAEMRESMSWHQVGSVPDLDERINRAVRSTVEAAVDAAVKRAALPKLDR